MKKILLISAMSLIVSCANNATKQQQDMADDAKCREYGYNPSSIGYLNCREQLTMERLEKRRPADLASERNFEIEHKNYMNDTRAFDVNIRRERLENAKKIEKNAIVSDNEAREYLARPAGSKISEDEVSETKQYIKKADLAGKIAVEEHHAKTEKAVTGKYFGRDEVKENAEYDVEKREKKSDIGGNEPQIDAKDLKAREKRQHTNPAE